MDVQQKDLAGPGLQPVGAPGDLSLSRTIGQPILERSSRPTNSGAKVRTLLAELPYPKERRLGRDSRRSSGGSAAPWATEVVFNGLHHRRRQTVIVASAILLAVLAYLAITGTIM